MTVEPLTVRIQMLLRLMLNYFCTILVIPVVCGLLHQPLEAVCLMLLLLPLLLPHVYLWEGLEQNKKMKNGAETWNI